MYFHLLFFLFCPISIIYANNQSYSLRLPSYHEFYSAAMISASFSSNLKLNEIFGDLSTNDSVSCNQSDFASDLTMVNSSNSTILPSDNRTVSANLGRASDRIMDMIKEKIVKFILERTDLLELVLSGQVSLECLADLYYLAESTKKADAWALAVIDSMGKPPAGLETGNVIWAGDYEQCLDIVAPVVNISIHFGPFRYTLPANYNGQYCLASITRIGDPGAPVPEGYLLSGLTIGLCTPSQCTPNMLTSVAKEVDKLFNSTLSKLGLQFAGVTCPKKKDHLDGTAILAILVVTVMLALVIAGTICECVLRRRAKANAKLLDDGEVSVSVSHTDGPVVSDDKALIDVETNEFGIIGRVITSFSILTNGRRLFSTKTPSRPSSSAVPLPSSTNATSCESMDLACLHGIRFLSMAWIILGNTYYFSFAMSSNPLDRLNPDKRDFWFQAILQAAYACDTFFLISACLVATQFFSIADRYPHLVGTCRFWITYYFQRILRLTPPYMLILCVYIGLWKYVGNGPFWPQEGFEVDNCRRTWWSNLFYINNYLNIQNNEQNPVIAGREYCAGWTWYLANDMQFYWICPLVLYPLFKSRQSKRWAWIGYGILTVFIVSGLTVTGIIARVNEFPPNMFPAELELREKAELMKDELYFKPYPHLPCYAVGLLLALLLRRYRQRGNPGMRKILVCIGWSLSFSFAMAIIFGLWPNYRGHPFSPDLSACYVATSRFVFAICVAWVAYACLTGYGGYVNTFLAWPFFRPLSRLTFCAYLIHPMLLLAYFFSRRTTFYYTEFVMVWFFGSFLVFTYLAAIGVALVFEFPFLTLNRRFLKRIE